MSSQGPYKTYMQMAVPPRVDKNPSMQMKHLYVNGEAPV